MRRSVFYFLAFSYFLMLSFLSINLSSCGSENPSGGSDSGILDSGTTRDQKHSDEKKPQCTDKCEKGLRQCKDSGFQVCKKEKGKCTAWSKVTPCSKGSTCNGGSCKSGCTNNCTIDVRQCIGDGFQICKAKSNGCTDWGKATACQKDEVCSGGKCKKQQGCVDKCKSGAFQCGAKSKGVQSCKKAANGCLEWTLPKVCGSGKVCSKGKCIKKCTDHCTLKAKQCDGNAVQTCERVSNGCTDWSSAKNCPAKNTCSGGKCVQKCTNQCSSGTRLCSGNGFQTCEKKSNGCYDWGKTKACKSGTICSGGNCVKNCSNQCSSGTKQCSGSGYQSCIKKSNGCYDWGNVTPCKSGTVCSGAKCVQSCRDQCSSGKKRCDGVRVQTCKKQASGCTEWSNTTTCPNGKKCSKTSYQCILSCKNKCSENSKRCATNGIQTCKKQTSGCTDWSLPKTCPTGQACKSGKCALTCKDLCALNTTQCLGTSVKICTKQSNGCTGWNKAQACPSGQTCQGNKCAKGCTHLCVPGQTTCQSGRRKKCVVKGKCWTWDSGVACPSGESCYTGTCAKGSTKISKSMELCGVHVYSGTLTIQGGSKITCKTGDLTIRAKKIFIDPASSIDLKGTSSSASGGRYRTCSPGRCSSSRGRTGAAGGGNGTKGARSLTTKYKYRSGRYGSCSCRSCYGSIGGVIRNTHYDMFVSLGGRGGMGCKNVQTYGSLICRSNDLLLGGKGGGVLRLYAEESITFLGKIYAQGLAGASGAAASGGGAGGSVLLAAPTIQLNGMIYVNGGSKGRGNGFSASCYSGGRNTDGGAGGKGRIKILYGNSYKNTGKFIGGVESRSWLPPKSLASSTHPSQALYYNDTFKEFKISWKKPYTSVKGYWYALSNNPSLRLYPGTGTYLRTTSLTLNASKFTKAGSWYFYILSVHSNSQAGSIANRWDIKINSRPHTITSLSHPSQSSWYIAPTKKTFTASWKSPSGVPSNSFRGFWYKIDRNASTMPGRSVQGWTYTTNKQVLLTRDWQGKSLDKWTYYFHLVAEDVAGNLTKIAAHYRIQLGAQPSKLNFYGYIKDKAGQALKGATVLLQPYGYKAVTDTNGYFIFRGIYAESYTLKASKKGMKDVSLLLKVNSSSSPYNLVMKP